jgi:Holliday junction resolvasome RuvABC DNA-binding subunit
MVDVHVAACFEEAFRALRSLGFREGESHAALARVRTDARSGPMKTEYLLRLALAALS